MRSPTRGELATDRRRGVVPLLLVVSTGYIAANLGIQGFIAMLPIVQDEFAISRTEAGLYSSFYYLSATIIAIGSGRLVDRLGPRIGLVCGAGVVGLMAVLHAVVPAFGVILALAFVTGIGFSVITPSVSGAVIRNVFAARRAGSMGIVHGVGGTGALAGTMVLPALGERVGWRPVMLAAGLAAVAIAVFVAFAYDRLTPDERPQAPALRPAEKGAFTAALAGLLSRRAFLATCAMGLVFGLTVGSATGHLALFLNQDLGFSPTLAGVGLGLFHVGGVLGQPSWGIINDRLYRGRRHAGMYTLALLAAAVAVLNALVISRVDAGFPVVAGVSFLLGFFLLGLPALYFTAVTEVAPAEDAGAATGIALVFSRIGIVVGAPLFGLVADLNGSYARSWLLMAAAAVAITVASALVLGRRARG
ncbi:MAG: MFS transporter [Spirochaetota bacterium]